MHLKFYVIFLGRIIRDQQNSFYYHLISWHVYFAGESQEINKKQIIVVQN